jgi:protein dithiol oxidoreductase (disulfide-forming)
VQEYFNNPEMKKTMNFLTKTLSSFLLLFMLTACGNTEKAEKLMMSGLTSMPEEPKIIEFFLYSCPHCKNTEPVIQKWQSKQQILFQRGLYTFEQIPAVFQANLHSDAKIGEKEAAIYYTLRHMGLEPLLRASIFDGIQSKKVDYSDWESIKRFLVTQNVSMEEFSRVIKSPTVKADVDRAEHLTAQYHVFAVPAFIMFNRKIILGKNYSKPEELENDLLRTTKEHYLSHYANPPAAAAIPMQK